MGQPKVNKSVRADYTGMGIGFMNNPNTKQIEHDFISRTQPLDPNTPKYIGGSPDLLGLLNVGALSKLNKLVPKNVLPTTLDKTKTLARTVKDKKAITDLLERGYVRTKEGSKYGNRVFWTTADDPLYNIGKKSGYHIQVKNNPEFANRPIRLDDGVEIFEGTKNGLNPIKYGFGGVIQGIAPFAGLLNLALPGLGSAVSGGMQVLGGKMEQNDALAEQEELLAKQKQQTAWAAGKAGQAGITNPYQSTFPYGGMVPSQTPVELEKEETFLTPDGQAGQVDGPSHEQGGVDIDLQPGTFVWSDKLKTSNGKTFAEVTAPLLRQRAKYEKIIKG